MDGDMSEQVARTVATTLTEAQVTVIREEFPENQFGWAEVLRAVLRDYFEARGIQLPEDPPKWGGWKRGRRT